MIFKGSKLVVSDNSGALIVKCINIYKVKNKKPAVVGDVVLVSVRDYISLSKQKTQINLKKKVTKGQMYKGVIVRTRSLISRSNEKISYGDNAVVLIKNENTFLFTRTFGPISKDLRKKGWSKLLMLADILI